MKKKILTFIKFGKFEHIEELYKHGKMFLNTISFFNEIEENHQGDRLEGARSRFLSENIQIKIKTPDMNEIIIDKSNGLIDDVIIHSEDIAKSNIYSMTYLGEDDVETENSLSPDLKKFGESSLFILNTSKFIERFHDAMGKLGFKYQFGPVKYVKNNFEGDFGLFRKREQYKYQREFRFLIKSSLNEPLVIQLGSLEDIAKIIPSDQAVMAKLTQRPLT